VWGEWEGGRLPEAGLFALAYDRIDARAVSTTGSPTSGTVSRCTQRTVLHDPWQLERERRSRPGGALGGVRGAARLVELHVVVLLGDARAR